MICASVGSARADVDVVRLDYTAPAECPDRDAFVTQIVARAPAVKFEASAPRTFAVSITTTPDGFAGTLIVDATADKQLAATRCDDLASALALVTALAIDPTASAAPEPPPPPPKQEVRVVAPPPRRDPGREWTPDLTAGAVVDSGVTPDPLLAGVLQLRGTWDSRIGRVAFELAALGGRDTTMAEGGKAAFTWLAGRPAGCVVIVRTLELSGCGHVEVGLVRATGEMIVNGRALNRLWWAAGAQGEARWPARSRGFIQLQLGVSVPITRDRYRFNPGVVIHETEVITGWLGLGVGVRFR